MDEKQTAIRVDATPEMRRGVQADIITAATNGSTTRLDFILTDGGDPASGDALGVLSARVFLDNANVLALRDMLIRHTENWTAVEAPADAR